MSSAIDYQGHVCTLATYLRAYLETSRVSTRYLDMRVSVKVELSSTVPISICCIFHEVVFENIALVLVICMRQSVHDQVK